MVMEFPDNVLNLDGHQNNGAQLKQFIQVSISLFFKESHVLLGSGVCRFLPLCLWEGGCYSWNEFMNDTSVHVSSCVGTKGHWLPALLVLHSSYTAVFPGDVAAYPIKIKSWSLLVNS